MAAEVRAALVVWQRAVAARPQKESRGYLIRDRDQVYGERFSRQARMLDIREAVIAPRSPWQNAYAERVIGSIRGYLRRDGARRDRRRRMAGTL
jgi:hypothetical protein